MTGTILENLSNKKLSIVISIILIIQLLSFFIGAFIAPSPSSTEQLLGLKCIADNEQEFSIPREAKLTPEGSSISPYNCKQISATAIHNELNKIRFAFQMPLPREGIQLDYSRWMQNLLTIIIPEVSYDSRLVPNSDDNSDIEVINATIRMKVLLGAKNIGDQKWKQYAIKNNLKRTIKCTIERKNRREGYKYDCDSIQLFELQSLYYDYYLINIEFISEEQSNNFGFLSDLSLVAIHQNGGFTKVWLSLKTIFTTITLLTFLWFIKRLRQLHRETTLLEKALIFLGCALTQLNVPIEFLSLWFDIEFMTFLSDLRQGLFHCALLSFWIIFTGEHLLDGIHRSRISSYYKQLSVVLVAYISLFIFNLSQRGIQWIDPFFTIWEVDYNFAIIFIATACIASFGYLIFLCIHIWLAFRNISTKQSSLPSMSSTRRLVYQGIIYRFKFLLIVTLICAVATVFAYVMGQATDDQWNLDDSDSFASPLQWTSAMFTTVYALWNCYVITLLILYAPSHKDLGPNTDSLSEEIEFNRLTENEDRNEIASETNKAETSELTLLQHLATKQSFD